MPVEGPVVLPEAGMVNEPGGDSQGHERKVDADDDGEGSAAEDGEVKHVSGEGEQEQCRNGKRGAVKSAQTILDTHTTGHEGSRGSGVPEARRGRAPDGGSGVYGGLQCAQLGAGERERR